MKFLDQDIAPLGMGCWPIGGPMFRGSEPLGYVNSDDAESIRTIVSEELDVEVTLAEPTMHRTVGLPLLGKLLGGLGQAGSQPGACW